LFFGRFTFIYLRRCRMNQTLIILPTINERENLPRVAQKLLSLPVGVDVLVVDGNSSDGTGKIADELAAKHPQIHVLHEQKKTGWAAPTSPGSNGRWNAATSSSSSWTAIFHTTRMTCLNF
jgi:cellulose synthase/poly-beta-1,6-N-acetylglucosamine synthase-like glycosyltransferase